MREISAVFVLASIGCLAAAGFLTDVRLGLLALAVGCAYLGWSVSR